MSHRDVDRFGALFHQHGPGKRWEGDRYICTIEREQRDGLYNGGWWFDATADSAAGTAITLATFSVFDDLSSPRQR